MRWHLNLLVVAVTFVVACSSSQAPVEPGIGGTGAAGGSDRPIVSSDGGLGAGYDAPVRKDTNASLDAAVKLDGKVDTGSATDALGEAGTGDPELCSLLTQNCPNNQAKAQGCYPFGKGGSKCAIEGDAVPGVLCNNDSDCTAGSICGKEVPVCVSICQQGFLCGGVNACVPLQGYATIGYCRP
ncbi:MAG: hypothetical protein SF187_13310 [Deltaproteobacteria bacterium]|nr:hypothetical protein [Deltaproteobacteria bacterium]